MRKTAVLVVLVLAVAAVASAQMMSGRGPGVGMPGMGGGNGQMAGNLTMGAMHLTVAPDGTVLTVDRRYDATTKTVAEKLIAYNATSSKAWTYATTGAAHAFEIAGAHVILSTGRGQLGATFDSELIALNLSDGKVAWRLKLDGIAMNIEPAANQLYVLVVKPNSSNGALGVFGAMMSGDRTLVAISLSGVVLWTQPLGQ